MRPGLSLCARGFCKVLCGSLMRAPYAKLYAKPCAEPCADLVRRPCAASGFVTKFGLHSTSTHPLQAWPWTWPSDPACAPYASPYAVLMRPYAVSRRPLAQNLVAGTRYPVPGAWYHVAGTRYWVPARLMRTPYAPGAFCFCVSLMCPFVFLKLLLA